MNEEGEREINQGDDEGDESQGAGESITSEEEKTKWGKMRKA